MAQTKPDSLILTESTLNTHFAETYRTLRANIGFSSIDRPVRTILVTSASPREGKTTTVLNLGIIIGQTGTRVIIVDADFRHPSLHKLLGLSSNGTRMSGLSNVIVGKSSLDEAIVPTGCANLSLLPAGVMPPNPSELLASQRMRTVMQELQQRADIVLLDSPPCLLYADAVVLSGVTDGVLYILRAGGQDKAAQRRVQKQLQQQAKAHMLGVVFNDVEMDDSSSNYTYYYSNGKHRRN
jgi:capsular exopolysaccharide synthesis family protein